MSTSTLQRYRNDTIMISHSRSPPKSHKIRHFKHKTQCWFKSWTWPQKTSNDLKRSQKVELYIAVNEEKNKVKGESMHEIGESNQEFIDEILQKTDI